MEAAAPKLLLDEHVWQGLAAALRERGFDVVHVYEIGRGGLDDEAQLSYAAEQGRALLTFNARHFVPLAAKWFFADKSHAGIVISDELPLSELLRRVEKMLRSCTAKQIENTVQWLQGFR